MQKVISLHLLREMESNMSDYGYVANTRDLKGIFPCTDGFTDERAVQCDVQVWN